MTPAHARANAPAHDAAIQRSTADTATRHAAKSADTAATHAAKSAGRPLEVAERQFFGTAFGADFSGVRVHTDDHAATAASRAGALGYTVGNDIFFAPGSYAPASQAGRQLLGHELTHVVQQRRGGRAGGAAEHPESEAEATRAGRRAAAGQAAPVSLATPVGMARQPAAPAQAPAVKMYEYRNEQGEVVRVTEAEYQNLRAQATRQLTSALARLTGTAEVWRNTHAQHMNDYHVESWGELWDKPSRIFGVASDIRAGVVPPPLAIWGHPQHVAEQAREALSAGNLAEAGRLLRLAESQLKDAKQQWNSYIQASIGGGETLAGELEVVRDVSFAIAIGAAAIVAAPVIAAGAGAAATGIGLTGATATVVGTGTAALGTGVVATGGGALLRGTADAAGQKLATGKVNWHKTGAEVRKHAKENFVTGVTAGLAPGMGQAFGAGAEGLSTTQNILRQGAADASSAFVANVAGTGADTAYAVGAEGKDWQHAKDENLVPGLKQAGTAALTAGASGALGGATKPLTSKLAAAGRPALSKAVQHGSGALAAAGTTLATGGSGKEALSAALQATVISAAQHPGARGPAGPKKPAGKPAPQLPPELAGVLPKAPGAPGAEHAPAGPQAGQPAAKPDAGEPATKPGEPAGKSPEPETKPPAPEPKPDEPEPKSPEPEPKPPEQEPPAPEPTPDEPAIKPTAAGPEPTPPAPAAKPKATAEPAVAAQPGAATPQAGHAAGGPAAPGATAGKPKPAAEPPGTAPAKPKSPRLRRNEPFTPGKRRPNLGHFQDVPPATVERHTGLRTNPEARIGIFHEPFPGRVPKPAGATRQELGHSTEAALKEDLIPGGGPGLRLRSTAGGKGRVTDVGVHEVTVETHLSTGKLDQLWSDLVERNQIMLTVEKLSPRGERRLARTVAIYERVTGKRPHVTVRELSP